MHRSAAHRKTTIDVIKAIPKNGGSRPNGVGPKCLQDFKGFADVYGRLAWDRPAITITHYARNPASGRFVHPEQNRGLTMREAARLQSFPDGFEFTGGFDDIFRQIGEAVPPLLSLSVAASTLAALKGEVHSGIEKLVTEPVNDSFAGVIAGIKNSRR
jgi:DNA (cytosine-5)-methyltransferase 1